MAVARVLETLIAAPNQCRHLNPSISPLPNNLLPRRFNSKQTSTLQHFKPTPPKSINAKSNVATGQSTKQTVAEGREHCRGDVQRLCRTGKRTPQRRREGKRGDARITTDSNNSEVIFSMTSFCMLLYRYVLVLIGLVPSLNGI